MRSVKKEIRILGFDDGPFKPKSREKVLVVGVVYRGGEFFDGVIRTWVRGDGLDATDNIAEAVNKSRHKEELRVLMFKGVTIGGFNIIDIKKLHKKTNLPIIIVARKKPNMEKIKKALKNFDDYEQRWKLIKNAGKIYKTEIKKNKSLYYQFIGLEKNEVEKIIRVSCTRSLIPEPLRISHLIASAMVKGESKGRA
ncbi:MAG: DUF99 family protein [Candidatus Aenigmarchaeota archaeon]|nr:DUF99 family protein [Candidatus Aenigmarchaeota archaeon]